MSEQHTPGPWEVGSGACVIDNEGLPIAVCYGDSVSKELANAFLTAAAPDLLAALKFVADDPRFKLLGLVTHEEVATAIKKATRK